MPHQKPELTSSRYYNHLRDYRSQCKYDTTTQVSHSPPLSLGAKLNSHGQWQDARGQEDVKPLWLSSLGLAISENVNKFTQ